MASQQLLDEIFSKVERLPEMPAVALQVTRLMEQSSTSAKDLAKVIMMDPNLTTKVLRLCNSAQYGFSRKIATISEAVSILGYRELKQIIFTVLSHGFLNRPIQGYGLEKGALWQNAVTCATYARHIAQKVYFKDPELAFIAALLRDIGKIALETYLKGQVEGVEETARKNKSSFCEAEEQVLGVSHMEIGAALAQKWNLPTTLVHTIGFHHHPELAPKDVESDAKMVLAIVHLADTYTMMTGTGLGVDGLMYPLDNSVFETLRLEGSPQILEVLYAELLDLSQEINTIEKTFQGERLV